MTAPSGLGGLVGTGSATNPDGTPNFPVAVGGSVPAKQTIWNLPTDIPNGQKIWYDTQVSKDSNFDPTTESRNRGNYGTTSHSKQVLFTPDGIMSQIAALSANNPNEFQAIQKALSAFGTISTPGVWSPDTETALRRAMSSYWQLSHGAGVGMSFVDYLLQAGQQVVQKQATTTATPRVMDPAQIRTAAQNAAQQALGKGLSEKQLEQFVTQFQTEQLSNADDPYTTSYKLPGEAMSFAQNADPTDYRQNQAQTFANTLINMFAPTASQRPNMTPTPTA